MNREFQEKAEDYLLGKMSLADATEFEKLLRDNQELHEEFLVISDINKHFLGNINTVDIPDSEYVDKLKTVLKSKDAERLKNEIAKAGSDYKNQSGNKRVFLKIAASLAFILLFSAGFYFFNIADKKNLYASYYSPTDLPSVITRGSEDAIINKAIVAFQNKKYKESLDLFESSEAIKNSNNVPILLHYGVIQLENGNLTKAIDQFNKVINSDSIDKSKGLWFKALAYLKAGDLEKARQILKTISENPTYFKHNKAKELLSKIKK